MSVQQPPGLLGFIDLVEGLTHGPANERLADPFAAQFLFDPLWTVALALRTPERPIPSEVFVVQIIEGAQFLDGRVGDTGRAAAAAKITADFGFAARAVPQVTQAESQRIRFRAGRREGGFVSLSGQNKLSAIFLWLSLFSPPPELEKRPAPTQASAA